MQHGYPLARLAAFVAAARMRQQPTRIVVRNTERFGLIHLYFQHGGLARVEGHRSSPFASLTDLSTWQYGVVRQDEVASASPHNEIDPRLEAALNDALQQLEQLGVVQPAPPVRSAPASSGATSPHAVPHAARHGAYAESSRTAQATRMSPSAPISHTSYAAPHSFSSHASHASQASYTSPHAVPSPADLPPLDALRDIPEPPASLQHHISVPDNEEERITVPQWQLIALVVRQIMEKAGALIGDRMAEQMLRQALANAARNKQLLNQIELDNTGWLHVLPPHEITRHPAYDVSEAIATLLTGYEARCASLIGAERAQGVITAAASPFRASLVQIGLDISN